MKNLTNIVKRLGGEIAIPFGANITHVVSGMLESGCVARTMKYFHAILAGVWVVSIEWVFSSGKKNHWIDESKFEICLDTSGKISGPRLGRLNKQNAGKPLLEGYKLYFCGKFTWKDEELESLLYLGGAMRLSKPLKGHSHDDKCFVICQDDPTKVKEIIKKFGENVVVSPNWLYDCIGNFKIVPIDKYILYPKK